MMAGVDGFVTVAAAGFFTSWLADKHGKYVSYRTSQTFITTDG